MKLKFFSIFLITLYSFAVSASCAITDSSKIVFDSKTLQGEINPYTLTIKASNKVTKETSLLADSP